MLTLVPEDQKDMSMTRLYFQDGQQCYIMDAKSMGNIGRYLNVSLYNRYFQSRWFGLVYGV
jgi:hypothetical protein